jgi:hypothetical protein
MRKAITNPENEETRLCVQYIEWYSTLLVPEFNYKSVSIDMREWGFNSEPVKFPKNINMDSSST